MQENKCLYLQRALCSCTVAEPVSKLTLGLLLMYRSSVQTYIGLTAHVAASVQTYTEHTAHVAEPVS